MQKESPLLPPAWNIPRIFRDRLGERVGRQRIMFADGHLLVILHEPPKPEETVRRGRLFWREPDGTWHSNSLGSGIRALQKHLDDYAEAVQSLQPRNHRQRAEPAVTDSDVQTIDIVVAAILSDRL